MRVWWTVLALALGGCSKGSPEGTYLSESVPLEVKKEGDAFSVTLAGDLQMTATRDGRVLTADHNGKTVTVEFDEAWNEATVKEGVLARVFTRVPPEELAARLEAAKAKDAEEKKAKKKK